jgi:hypothetical protein
VNTSEIEAELARRQEAYGAAKQRLDAARTANRLAWQVGRDVAAEVVEYHRAVLHRQREDDPAEARRLTLHVLERVKRDELVLEPVDPHRPAAGLRIVDPSRARELADAERAASEARLARDRFAQVHAEALRRASDQEAMERLRRTLDGDDPVAARAALQRLGREEPGEATALRTTDLTEGARR